MKKSKGFAIAILTILTTAFIAFVVIMQHNFTNPDFATAQSQPSAVSTEESPSLTETEEDTEKDKDEEKANKKSESSPVTMYVTADLLNVRSGPTTDGDIVGVVGRNQEVKVEDMDDSEEWVKIITDEFTGYVNSKYLTNEE
ncbi:SH3 domain-containing protein [Oceanobacillus salinisoli]|uniref:SH3 domain-containing protein n=1 Tax=Oceanobacillus salinisoli TaxID=2678611 RepID=UPI0018CC05BD|nr:SH3 domain-containing protein [Oceanobacillus salinisoli]